MSNETEDQRNAVGSNALFGTGWHGHRSWEDPSTYRSHFEYLFVVQPPQLEWDGEKWVEVKTKE